MNEQKNYNGRGIFYGVIGVATLVVAIIGATFAYFTASKSDENTIKGNMATIELGLAVSKVTTAGDDTGLIPMSNSMVEVAVNTGSGMGSSAICVDDTGNAVCQVYKVDLTNKSSAAVFVDGYVALIGGSGLPADYTYDKDKGASTTMRWAQVFCTPTSASDDGDAVESCTTAGDVVLGSSTEKVTFTSIDAKAAADAVGHNTANIRSEYKAAATAFTPAGGTEIALGTGNKGVLAGTTISSNVYTTIGVNYIRTSDHKFATPGTLSSEESYSQAADVTSALVYNQLVYGKGSGNAESRTYYFVVWLSETGTNQTAGAADAATSADNFFQGQVKFLSAQGSEVSATFGGYTRVQADTTKKA